MTLTVETIHKTIFRLQGSDMEEQGRITYTGNDFFKADMIVTESFLLICTGTGVWHIIDKKAVENRKPVAVIKVKPGTLISIKLECRKKKYNFRKSAGWKLRFLLLDQDGDEMLSILPSINWEKESHNYILQLNEEFEEECDPFLILQAVHCANVSMSMLTGGKVPALINI